jgi:hypothetical protein
VVPAGTAHTGRGQLTCGHGHTGNTWHHQHSQRTASVHLLLSVLLREAPGLLLRARRRGPALETHHGALQETVCCGVVCVFVCLDREGRRTHTPGVQRAACATCNMLSTQAHDHHHHHPTNTHTHTHTPAHTHQHTRSAHLRTRACRLAVTTSLGCPASPLRRPAPPALPAHPAAAAGARTRGAGCRCSLRRCCRCVARAPMASQQRQQQRRRARHPGAGRALRAVPCAARRLRAMSPAAAAAAAAAAACVSCCAYVPAAGVCAAAAGGIRRAGHQPAVLTPVTHAAACQHRRCCGHACGRSSSSDSHQLLTSAWP